MNSTRYIVLLSIILLIILGGCSTYNVKKASVSEEVLPDIRISEFMLSPGDVISIVVYKHEDLNRTMTIPPDGIIFFPIVGEMDVNGQSLNGLRMNLTENLSAFRTQMIRPGDEISVSIFLHEEYDRSLIVPSDGIIFFPNVGEINVESKSLKEIREYITERISDYVVDPQVIIDIVKTDTPSRIANAQVSVEVESFGGNRIYLLGEVKVPGIYLLDRETDLLETIAMAGGFTADASRKSILIIRRTMERNQTESILVSIDEFIENSDYRHNPFIRAGDVIVVPRTAIADVDIFLSRLARILSPFLDIENGIWIGQNIVAGPYRQTSPYTQ